MRLMRPRLRILLATLALASVGCATHSAMPRCGDADSGTPPPNFAQLTDAAGTAVPIYRGAALGNCREVAYLQSLGIRHILQLDAPPSKNRSFDTADGMTILQMAFKPNTIGTRKTCGDVRIALDYLGDPANWPIYIHCSKGQDRTGYIAAVYELETLGRSLSSVIGELHEHGHGRLERVVFGQIDRELESGRPACAVTQPRTRTNK